jgi:phenylpropionate dioxygenase-like ring-hydroxylating dioxygenase large terminal subunit
MLLVLANIPFFAFSPFKDICRLESHKCVAPSLFQIPMECFEEPWVIFRGKDGKPGCVQNTCAHRACPLHLGSVNEGRIACPYHG